MISSVSYQLDDVKASWDENPELFKENWHIHKESRLGELNPDVSLYDEYSKAGYFVFFSLRDRGAIKGYCAFFINHAMRDKNFMFATQDMFYLQEGYRGHAFYFLPFCDRELKAMGVRAIYRSCAPGSLVSKLYERYKYEIVEIVYKKEF